MAGRRFLRTTTRETGCGSEVEPQPAVEVSDTDGLRSESGRFAEPMERSGDEPHNRVAPCNILSGRCSGVESVRETGWSHDEGHTNFFQKSQG